MTEAGFKVIAADEKTGIILTLDGESYVQGLSIPYLLFASFDEARSFARSRSVKMSSIEFNIYNEADKFLCCFVRGIERNDERDVIQ